MTLFRERLLARLVERHAISEHLARKLVAWTHPGFSSHIGEAIPFESKKTIEDLACYLVRAPFSLQKLVYLDGHKAVLYRSRLNPSLGRNFEAMDPLEWLARLADHIPDPGRHRTHFYAHYANRVRGERPSEGELRPAGEAEPPSRRRSSPSWARLLAKVFQVDPLVCRRCGGPLKVVATSPTRWRSVRPWAISASARPRSRLPRSAMSSACRWTKRGERSSSSPPDRPGSHPSRTPQRAWCRRPAESWRSHTPRRSKRSRRRSRRHPRTPSRGVGGGPAPSPVCSGPRRRPIQRPIG